MGDCAGCGAAMGADARFCSTCGAAAAERPKQPSTGTLLRRALADTADVAVQRLADEGWEPPPAVQQAIAHRRTAPRRVAALAASWDPSVPVSVRDDDDARAIVSRRRWPLGAR